MKFDQGLIAMQKSAAATAAVPPSRDDVSESPRALPSDLPVFGVGHSLGSLIHLLLCARYGPDRCGNALLSFNNKPVKEAVPVFRWDRERMRLAMKSERRILCPSLRFCKGMVYDFKKKT